MGLLNTLWTDGTVGDKVKVFLFSGWQTFDGHSDYINDLVFAPKEGQEVASVSDDHTCRYAFSSKHYWDSVWLFLCVYALYACLNK